jgi:formiminoglutamate deiminase
MAWIGGEVVDNILIACDDSGIILKVTSSAEAPSTATLLDGLTFPGFANTHSHAFHRALRGRGVGDTFWEWRRKMYEVAEQLNPESYRTLATAVFAEMALAGFTLVGEFHYLHHQPGGKPYDEPNAMGIALVEAAQAAGVRLTLLDTCYLQGGIDRALEPPQRRFADGDVNAWIERRAELRGDPTTLVGAAIHSVRAVPRAALAQVAESTRDAPLHIHLSEQRAENEQALAVYGLSPTALLAKEGVLAQNLTAVHATHLESDDIESLAANGASVCACPTTEADLGDGIGPFAALAAAGVELAIGTDQHVLVDPFYEAQRLEFDQRLASSRRSIFSSKRLVDALSSAGYRALGWNQGGRIAEGALCDLTSVRVDSVRLAGVPPSQLPFALTAGDVDTVVVGGRVIVQNSEHLGLPMLARDLREEIVALFP